MTTHEEKIAVMKANLDGGLEMGIFWTQDDALRNYVLSRGTPKLRRIKASCASAVREKPPASRKLHYMLAGARTLTVEFKIDHGHPRPYTVLGPCHLDYARILAVLLCIEHSLKKLKHTNPDGISGRAQLIMWEALYLRRKELLGPRKIVLRAIDILCAPPRRHALGVLAEARRREFPEAECPQGLRIETMHRHLENVLRARVYDDLYYKIVQELAPDGNMDAVFLRLCEEAAVAYATEKNVWKYDVTIPTGYEEDSNED